jgi:hypothetical protein
MFRSREGQAHTPVLQPFFAMPRVVFVGRLALLVPQGATF